MYGTETGVGYHSKALNSWENRTLYYKKSLEETLKFWMSIIILALLVSGCASNSAEFCFRPDGSVYYCGVE